MLEQSVGTDLRSSFNEQLQHLGVQSSAEDPEEVQKGDTANTQQSLGEAEILHCLSYPAVCRSIGHDLKTLDKGRDAIRQVYFNAVANTAPRNKQDTGRVPTLFANLAALEDCDEAWKVLRNGTRKFQSFISFAPITGLHSERYGQKNGNSPAGRKEQSRSATSPVVCFVSRPHEGQGTVCTARHTAICTGPDKIGAERYVIPALALFTVVSDTDEADACLPGNQIRQRVIVLQFTYKLPTAKQMKQIKSTRSDYRKQLEDLIGPKPTEPWSVQYDACLKEGCEFSKGFSCPEKAYQLQDKNRAKVVPRIMNAGFTKEESEMFFLLSNPAVCRAMGNALRQPRSDYAAITHSFYNLIATKALALQRADDPKRIAPALYKDLQALEERDPEWHNIFTKDAHGFQGFTSYSPVTGLFTPSPDSYDPNGIAYDDGKIVVDAPVVRFVSSPYDPRSSTLHSAVCTSIHERNGKQQYTLPPLTLFKVVEDTPAPFEYLPGKFMNQRLITVQLTYTVPPSLVKEEESPDEPSSRFLSKVADLRYGGLNDAGGGISGLLEDPVLTMEEEFGRNDQWVDWNGHNFWGLKEWEYVTGPAKEGEAGVDAIGDKGHDGWLPEDFLRCINGTLEDEQLHLDMDEVLAVRLYTGAPYQVINQFLRAISNVQGIWRKELVANPKVCSWHVLVPIVCSVIGGPDGLHIGRLAPRGPILVGTRPQKGGGGTPEAAGVM